MRRDPHSLSALVPRPDPPRQERQCPKAASCAIASTRYANIPQAEVHPAQATSMGRHSNRDNPRGRAAEFAGPVETLVTETLVNNWFRVRGRVAGWSVRRLGGGPVGVP